MPYRSFATWINDLLACIGGCFGCCTKPGNLFLVQEQPGGLQHPIDRSSMSDDFWTSSAYDIDVNAAMSQRSRSFLSTSNPSLPVPYDLGTKTMNDPFEFVNHGLTLWNQSRIQWTRGKKQPNRSHKSRDRRISVCATYDGLLGTKKAFRKPIPLTEMVEFLVDVWDEEGLYE